MRKVKIYAGDVEKEDRISRHGKDGNFGRVWRIREMTWGRYEFGIQYGGNEEIFEKNAESFVWMEIP